LPLSPLLSFAVSPASLGVSLWRSGDSFAAFYCFSFGLSSGLLADVVILAADILVVSTPFFIVSFASVCLGGVTIFVTMCFGCINCP